MTRSLSICTDDVALARVVAMLEYSGAIRPIIARSRRLTAPGRADTLTPMQQHRTLTDWALLLALSAMWGSTFLFNKLGVATVPPATLVAVRCAVGLLTLLVLLRLRGLMLPPFGPICGTYT